jgi:diacylglycerol kinase family enzyme
MRVIVLTNPAAGARADAVDELRKALTSVNVSAEVWQVPGHQIAASARDAISRGVDAIVAAGGDGTVSAVASALAGTDVPLGVIRSGTLNHFARDANIPTDLAAAARVIAAGNTRRFDVAELNGRTFINNSSIGIYPHIVGKRDRQRERLGRGKWISMLIASVSVFRRYPTVRVRICVGGRAQVHTTPFVFVGNNRYEMNLRMLGRRGRLDAGELSLWFATVSGRFGLLWLALRTVLGRLEQAKDFVTMTVREVTIESKQRRLRVALDGEVMRMQPPLNYRVRPGALKVLALPAGETAPV